MATRLLKIVTIFILLAGALLLPSCIADVDFTGFIRSTESVNERFEKSKEYNLQHEPQRIICNNDDYKLFFASDIHIGGIENLREIFRQTKLQAANGLFLVGDIVSGKQEDYDLLVQTIEYDSINNCYMQVGNHELYFEGWKWYKEYFGTSVYTVEIITPTAKDLIICLDSGGGTLGNLQLDWLKQLLEESRSNYRHCIILHHCNFFESDFSTSATPFSEELYVLMDLFCKNNVDMVIMGHVHISSEENFGPTRYLCLDAAIDGYEGASYLVLDCSNDYLVYQYHSLD